MSQKCRKCVICGKRETNSSENTFFSKFPREEIRCKQWVKIVGNPELVYVPIEKLCHIRYVCGIHFEKRCFNRKKNRLKKTAIPTLKLSSLPLTDEQLKDFPFHVASWLPPEGNTPKNEDITPLSPVVQNVLESKIPQYIKKLVKNTDHSYASNCLSNQHNSTGPKKPKNRKMASSKKTGGVQALFTQNSESGGGNNLRHLFEESAALDVYDKTTINLAAGCPGPDLLSTLPQIFREATQHRMDAEEKNNCYLFQYGPTAGWWGMQEALAKFLSENYGDTVDRSNLVLTCGATHGLHLIVSILLAPRAVIFVEEFTYMIALSLFKEFPDHQIIRVPLTSQGVDVDKFESIVAETKKYCSCDVSTEKPFWAMFYTIPNFHNPTSTLLPPESCKKLVDLARRYDLLVTCDDVYNLLHYTDGKPPQRLFSYDVSQDSSRGNVGSKKSSAKGHVISNGSFSKILAPGVRVGWMEMDSGLVQRFRQSGILQSGGSMNNVMYGLMQSIIELGLADKQLKWYRQIYKDRMKVLCESLRQHLPDSCTFVEPQGGYFVWINTPVDAAEFLAWSKEHGGPGAVPAVRFVPQIGKTLPKSSQNAVRVSVGFHDDKTLREAGKVLGETMKEYLKYQVSEQ